MATETAPQSSDIYSLVDSYDWDHDDEFQGGLQAILGSASSPEQVAHLTLRARCFYYSRKFSTKIDFDSYRAWREQHAANDAPLAEDLHATHVEATPAAPVAPPSSSAMGNAPTPASFAEICQLISEGKPIPGIKEIPETVLEGQGTESSVARRKKPWEKEGGAETGATGIANE